MVTQMKALVLSGGAGTRSRPSTHTSVGKPVPVALKAVLFHGQKSTAQVCRIVVGTAAKLHEAIGDGPAHGLESTFAHEFRCSPPGARVIGPGEQPARPGRGLALVGVVTGPTRDLSAPVIHDAVRALEQCRRGESETTHAPHHQCVPRVEPAHVGRHVEVTPAPGVSRAHRLVRGDRSKVRIHVPRERPGHGPGRAMFRYLGRPGQGRPHPQRGLQGARTTPRPQRHRARPVDGGRAGLEPGPAVHLHEALPHIRKEISQ